MLPCPVENTAEAWILVDAGYFWLQSIYPELPELDISNAREGLQAARDLRQHFHRGRGRRSFDSKDGRLRAFVIMIQALRTESFPFFVTKASDFFRRMPPFDPSVLEVLKQAIADAKDADWIPPTTAPNQVRWLVDASIRLAGFAWDLYRNPAPAFTGENHQALLNHCRASIDYQRIHGRSRQILQALGQIIRYGRELHLYWTARGVKQFRLRIEELLLCIDPYVAERTRARTDCMFADVDWRTYPPPTQDLALPAPATPAPVPALTCTNQVWRDKRWQACGEPAQHSDGVAPLCDTCYSL